MVTLTINDVPCEVKDGSTIIEAARSNGIHIPALGYDPRVSPPNNVEISVVEILNDKGVRFVSPCQLR